MFFFKDKNRIFGHTVKNGKISPSRAKIKAVANVAVHVAVNVKDIQLFLSLTGFFRKLIKGYAKAVRPLTDLLKTKIGKIKTAFVSAVE